MKWQNTGVNTKLYLHAITHDIEATSFTDANQVAEHVLGILNSLFKMHACFRISYRQRILKTWITTVRIRNHGSMHKNLNTDSHNLILATSYKRYRNLCNDLLIKLTREYERSEFNKAKHSLKKLGK